MIAGIIEEVFTTEERRLLAMYYSGSRHLTAMTLHSTLADIYDPETYEAVFGTVLKLMSINDYEFTLLFEGEL